MATATLVSTSEYLSTTWRPDRELVEGELRERNGGEYEHSNLQRWLIIRIGAHERAWNVRVLPEQRIQVVPGRYRIPDVCVISRGDTPEPVFTRPPLICIEILSKDDPLRTMQERVDDYVTFGVPNIWLLDPAKRRAWICSDRGFQTPENGLLEVPDSPIRIPLDELFEDAD